MPDRSTGVQQGRTWFVFICDHEEYHGDYARPWPSEVGHTADEFTECSCGRSLRPVRVVEAVSPEPRETWEGASAGDRLNDILVEPEPREGEQEPPECDCGHAGTPEDKHHHTCSYGRWLLAKEAGLTLSDSEPDDPSVASVLRLTASRLRDPEHRWSVDPAVTLERLAEKLEKEDR